MKIWPTDETTGQKLISENEIKRTFALSKSTENFTAHFVQQLYAWHDRIISKVIGTIGERQL